jgi:hypothetical protein
MPQSKSLLPGGQILRFGGRMPLFLFIFDFITYIHSFIQSQYIHPSPFAEASLHILIACVLSGENFPVVPSRESNSGLPYSKPTRCQLSHAAPNSRPHDSKEVQRPNLTKKPVKYLKDGFHIGKSQP